MPKLSRPTRIRLLFAAIGVFGAALAITGVLASLPKPAAGGTCGPSTGSETAIQAIVEPGSIGAGPRPPASEAAARQQWQAFVNDCQTAATDRLVAVIVILVVSVAVALIGPVLVLRRKRKLRPGDVASVGLTGPSPVPPPGPGYGTGYGIGAASGAVPYGAVPHGAVVQGTTAPYGLPTPYPPPAGGVATAPPPPWVRDTAWPPPPANVPPPPSVPPVGWDAPFPAPTAPPSAPPSPPGAAASPDERPAEATDPGDHLPGDHHPGV